MVAYFQQVYNVSALVIFVVMYLKGLFLTIVLVFCGFLTFAQNSRDVGAPAPPRPQYQAEKKKTKKLSKLFKKEPKSDREAFWARQEEVQKQKKKEAKLAEKPEYSNPLYFGHKKPPKKRPVGKRKFCKVCHIVH